ncbi:MAG: DUF3090 domain-containing protein [Chloroflexi bacterium]|nr:DUF3090 domain-containing protein [Chloroflexota bacterium]MBI3733724.1 DUF3090 domain-containing protein [Chloroflexota bacterium]
MPQFLYEFNPTNKIVADAVGEPGRRTFYLQARQGRTLATVQIEKFQAQVLAESLDELLEKVGGPEAASTSELHLEEPLEPLFRAGQIGLGHDAKTDHIVIIIYEVAESEDTDPDTLTAVRFWISREQARALALHAVMVCAGGRPICVFCGNPIDADAHFCPKRNGH